MDEKNIPKAPVLKMYEFGSYEGGWTMACPTCGQQVSVVHHGDQWFFEESCGNCGQKLLDEQRDSA